MANICWVDFVDKLQYSSTDHCNGEYYSDSLVAHADDLFSEDGISVKINDFQKGAHHLSRRPILAVHELTSLDLASRVHLCSTTSGLQACFEEPDEPAIRVMYVKSQGT